MYIIISTPKSPKKSPIFGKVFSEYFLRQITNRHTFLCGSVEVWKMKIAIFCPVEEKKMGKTSANLPRIQQTLEDAIFSISFRYLLENEATPPRQKKELAKGL